MGVISLYSVSIRVTNAIAPVEPQPETHTQCPFQPTQPSKQIAPGPKKLTERQIGVLSGAVGSVCGLAAITGDFWIGVGCGVLVVVAMRVANI